MKLLFLNLFLSGFISLKAQTVFNKAKYNEEIIWHFNAVVFVCFPLKVKTNDGKIIKVLASNFGLFPCYYPNSYYKYEFADTLIRVLNFESENYDLAKCPNLLEHAIDNSLHEKLGVLGVKEVLKKYFTISNEKHFTIKRVNMTDKETFTVLYFLCENNYLISSNDGYYSAYFID